MSILNDAQIRQMVRDHGMIDPFVPTQVRHLDRDEQGMKPLRLLSYGLGSFGYDIRLSTNDFRIFRRIPGEVVDVKNFEPSTLHEATLFNSRAGKYFIIPAHTYGLGVALEEFNIPHDVVVVTVGKSTYARAGIIVNVTPAEPGWRGHLTIEVSNSSDADVKVYADEGIAQCLFFQGGVPNQIYSSGRKYQNQIEEVTLPRM